MSKLLKIMLNIFLSILMIILLFFISIIIYSVSFFSFWSSSMELNRNVSYNGTFIRYLLSFFAFILWIPYLLWFYIFADKSGIDLKYPFFI